MNYNRTEQGVAYGNAEVRGRLRMWKRRLAQNYASFCRAFEALGAGGEPGPIVLDMIKGYRSTRQRAFDKIAKALGPGVTLETHTLKGKNNSMALWSILKPREAVTMLADPSKVPESRRASLAQDCVTVNYITIGSIGRCEAIMAEGLWTLEVPDHALGRAVERSGRLHPEVIIREAHRNLLALSENALRDEQDRITTKFRSPYIKAGPGCFVGKLRVASDISTGTYTAHVRVETWLSDDMLHDDQIVLSEPGEPGDRLVDRLLRPRPLVRFSLDDDKLTVETIR